jgi:alanine racemase
MHRVGASPEDALRIVEAIDGRAELRLAGVWTHLAVADEAGNEFTAVQLARFRAVVDEIRGRGIDPGILHAANSAGTLWHPASHLDLVRCGIALYGLAPGPSVTAEALTPALRFEARVTFVKRVAAGEGISYGLRYRPGRPTTIATVPVGYADGVPRALSERGEVLIGGRRRRIAGTITMDQLMVDCGDADVQIGDEVVLLGRQGEAEVSADEWAALTGTINYEIVSRIGPRVVRRYE